MQPRRLAAVVAALALTLGAAGAALAAVPPGTLDQKHECAAGGCNSLTDAHPDAEYPLWYSQNGNNGANVGLGQTFTAGISGTLTGVELFLNRLDATAPANLTIQIESTSNGDPSGTVLASATVATSSIPTTAGWVGVTFATPPTVAAGTVYAITLPDLPQQDVAPWLVWGLDSTATAAYTDYAGGEAYASVAGAWATLARVLNDGDSGNADLAFRTYVTAAATPTPTATASPRATPTPTLPSQPPTDAVAPQGTTGSGGATMLVGLLAAVAAVSLILPARRPRRRRR
jgi:hypothetical protein